MFGFFVKNLSHNQVGKLGEKISISHIKMMGMKICVKNYLVSSVGEIDLICLDASTLVFVEVKTRVADPESLNDVIGKEKMRRIILAANGYRKRFNLGNLDYRFDLARVFLSNKYRVLSFDYWVSAFSVDNL